MKWIDSLEAKYKHLAIPGLIRIVVAFNALTYLLSLSNPGYLGFLLFDKEAILHGQVWRLVTYIFIPPAFGILWLFFALYFLWFLGDSLEQAWGSFKLNLFYFCGMAGCTLAAFFFGGGEEMDKFLNLSILFAFGTVFPEEIIYLFGILPVKAKWLALISFVYQVESFVTAGDQGKAAILVSFANYLLFFGPQLVHNLRHRQAVAVRRQEFARKSVPEDEPLHRCVVCKETEITNPDLDFRVSKDGDEYCTRHLPGQPPAIPTPAA